MASDFTRHPSLLGVPTLYELEEGTSIATYPHLVTQFGISFFQRTCIDVRIGPPEAEICHPTHDNFVQHPEPFDADDTLNMACRTLLIAGVQDAVKRSKLRMCVVWSPTSCSYVEADGSIFETACGVASPAGIAFEAAQLIAIRDRYPQINVAGPCGITREASPANATKEEIFAQAVGIVMTTGRRARVIWSESETIYAELTDKMGGENSRIRPCVIWSESETIDADPASWYAQLSLKYPYIVAGGQKECVLFYPDAVTKEELIAKAAEIVARGYPRVCVVWSSTESIWSRPPQQEVIW
jgi:hypothetical protein